MAYRLASLRALLTRCSSRTGVWCWMATMSAVSEASCGLLMPLRPHRHQDQLRAETSMKATIMTVVIEIEIRTHEGSRTIWNCKLSYRTTPIYIKDQVYAETYVKEQVWFKVYSQTINPHTKDQTRYCQVHIKEMLDLSSSCYASFLDLCITSFRGRGFPIFHRLVQAFFSFVSRCVACANLSLCVCVSRHQEKAIDGGRQRIISYFKRSLLLVY